MNSNLMVAVKGCNPESVSIQTFQSFLVAITTLEKVFVLISITLWTTISARPAFFQRILFRMLTTKTRLKLQDILTRLSKNEMVSLDERIFVQKYADRHSTVWHWLRKARSIQAKGHLEQGSMGGFMQQMNLPGQTSEDHFNGSQDDLGDWFQGSPQWVRRS